MRIIFSVVALCFFLFTQSMCIDTGSYDSTRNSYTLSAKQIRKIDSIIKDADATKLKFNIVQEQLRLSLQIEDSLKVKIMMLNARNDLMNEKISFFEKNDSLVKEESRVYRKLYIDVSASLDHEKSRSQNSTLWFAVGSVSGIALVYICSVVLSNIGN